MGLYKRLFARSLASGDPYQDKVYGERKSRLFDRVHGDVLEIGAGTGVNLPYLPDTARWTGIDPNPHMHKFVYEKADQLGMEVEMRLGDAEDLRFSNAQFDCVICTLVLCSVPDPGQALQEIKRVLKPGGHFLFIEHVAAPPGTLLHGMQKLVKPGWKLVADGCRPDRDLQRPIEQAGFSTVEVESFNSKAPIDLIRPHIAGWAVK